MSKDDGETGQRLLNPYIEIEDRRRPELCAHVNVSTFERCLDNLIPPFIDSGPNMTGEEARRDSYSIYGVVGRTVTSSIGADLNIAEPPISRTLMGFLYKEVLRRELPEVFSALNS